jgi:hypothetical protein
MTDLFVLGLIAFTSTGAMLIGIRGRLATRTLIAGVAEALEVLGAGLVFFAINLATGIVALLLARVVGTGYPSLYLAADVTVLILSLLQGLTLHCWRRAAMQAVHGPAKLAGPGTPR